jgi:hypothetical protein
VIFRMTFGFDGQGQGWSETHALKATTENPNALKDLATSVAQKRVAFLGKEFAINSVRISRYSTDDGTARARGNALLKQRFINPVQSDLMASEPVAVAVIAQCTTAAAFAPPDLVANQSRTYLGCPPDNAVTDAGQLFPGRSNYGTNFNQWAALLIQNNFGWLADARANDFAIQAISQNPDGTVQIVTGPGMQPGGLTPTANVIYPVRIRRVNGGVSPMNGPFICTYGPSNTWTTSEIVGLALAQVGGFLRVYRPISPFCGYNTIEMQLTVGKHQRGRPFGSSPGRARKRVRG